jgi:hypothetical protein
MLRGPPHLYVSRCLCGRRARQTSRDGRLVDDRVGVSKHSHSPYILGLCSRTAVGRNVPCWLQNTSWRSPRCLARVIQGLLDLRRWMLTGEKPRSRAMCLKLMEGCWWCSMLRVNGARMCVDEYGVAYGVRQNSGKFWPSVDFDRKHSPLYRGSTRLDGVVRVCGKSIGNRLSHSFVVAEKIDRFGGIIPEDLAI